MTKIDAVVLLSGGQDSTTCLAWANNRFGRGRVATCSFDYGQRHVRELEGAADIARELGSVEHRVFTIGALAELADSSLTSDAPISALGRVDELGGVLPTSFVPGRNLTFFALGAAYAAKLGARFIVTGVCETDYSGYPDCREAFVEAMEAAIFEGFPSTARVEILAPLMHLSKRETVELAQSLDVSINGRGVMRAMRLSVTCYEGLRPGCGQCPACVLRAKGFEEAGVIDPAHTEAL